jgi:serine/threonine protein kinase
MVYPLSNCFRNSSALHFLHTAKPEPIVHRDLKPANILLDHNFVSKIGDVGLAKLIPPTVSCTVTEYKNTLLAGTFCYMDPEYVRTGTLRPTSDLYALGIILLQLLTAKPPMAVIEKVQTAIQEGSFNEILDKTAGEWPLEETIEFAKLALKCTELRRRDRPDLETVVLPELERFRDLADAHAEHCTS